VREAEGGDAVTTGTVAVAPGWGSLSLRREGGSVKIDVVPPQPDDRYVPSVDRMLSTAAAAMGSDVLGVVLTGMGGDGGRGVRDVKGAGGKAIAESPESAVIFGMPQEAIATGLVDEVAALGNIPDLISRFALRR
jgi:two-component system chemotaxis response regulator CheB